MKGEGRPENDLRNRFGPNERSPGLFGTALRQTTGFVESPLRVVGLDWSVPDFSTLLRRQKTLAVNITHRRSKGPPNLLIEVPVP